MNLPARRLEWLTWAGLALLTLTLLLAFLLAQLKFRAAVGKPLPACGPVADFILTNQNGQAVSLADLRGHVWVADIIFTRCPGPCLTMTRQMKEVQQALPAASRTRLITLTTDPDFDSPAVLKTYAERFGANPNRWQFLTGTKKQLGDLAIASLKLTAIEKGPGERQSPDDLFVHSTIFVIVDRRGQLRGIYEAAGEGIEWQKSRAQVLAAIRRLEMER